MSSDQCIVLAGVLVQERLEAHDPAAQQLQDKLKDIYKIFDTPRVVIVPEAMIEEVDIGDGWSMHGPVDYAYGLVDTLASRTPSFFRLVLSR
jgi:hypothetical protein